MSLPDGSGPSRRPVPRHAVALTLALDALAGEASAALARAGVPSILLKGPAIARWLYQQEFRPYGDVDLLVPLACLQAVTDVFAGLGLVRAALAADHFDMSGHAVSFANASGLTVDLHTRLATTTVEPDSVFEALERHAVPLRLAGRTVTVLDDVGQFLVIALHAAQHGHDEPGPVEDLRRALSATSTESVLAAADLARALGATESFSGAAHIDSRLADVLGDRYVDSLSDVAVRARLHSLPRVPGVFVILTLVHGPWRRRWLVLRRAVWPSEQLLRQRLPAEDTTRARTLRRRWFWYQAEHLPVALLRYVRLVLRRGD